MSQTEPLESAVCMPTFLVGSERSGTTLLRLMLDHHPKIAFNNEFEYAVDQITANHQFPDIAAYHSHLPTRRQFRNSGFRVDDTLDYPSLVRSFLEQKRHRDAKEHVGATIHHCFDLIPVIWPEARYIHLLRDPRDVSRSVMNMGWAGNVYTASDVWKQAEIRCWENLKASLADDRWIEVRYENLITEPRKELDRICQFIGTDFDDAMFDYAKTSTYDAPDPKLCYQWKRKLSDREIRLVEAALGPWIERRGYERSGLRPLTVGPLQHRWLKANCRVNRARFRMRRYGLALYLQDHLSRRIPVGRWRGSIARRIREIDQSHVR